METNLNEQLGLERLKYQQLRSQYEALKEQFGRLALNSETSQELVANKLLTKLRTLEHEKSEAERNNEESKTRLRETLHQAVQTHQLLEAEQESISLQLQKQIENEKRQRKELEEKLQKVELNENVIGIIQSIMAPTKMRKPTDITDQLSGPEKSVLVQLNQTISRLMDQNKQLKDENSVLFNRIRGLNDELYLASEKNLQYQAKLMEQRKETVDTNFLLESFDENKFNEQKRLSISSAGSSTQGSTSISDSETQTRLNRLMPGHSPLNTPMSEKSREEAKTAPSPRTASFHDVVGDP